MESNGEIVKKHNVKCENCTKIHRYTWSNDCYLCIGIVKSPFRDCDVCRICDKNDTGKVCATDLAPDEVGVYTSAFAKLLQTWLSNSFKRPCTPKCVEFKTCEKLDKRKS